MAKAKDDTPAEAAPFTPNEAQRQMLEWLAKPPLGPPGFAFGEHEMRMENERLVEAGITTPFDGLADGWSGVQITDAGWKALEGLGIHKPKPAEPADDHSNKSASSSDQ